jgi:hypothetical protein
MKPAQGHLQHAQSRFATGGRLIPKEIAAGLPVRHLLGYIEQKPAISLRQAAEESPKTAQVASIFSPAAPGDVVRALPLGKIGKCGRFLAVVEELVERNFHRARQLFESLDCRNGVSVLDARDVAAKQTCPLFDVALREIFVFT